MIMIITILALELSGINLIRDSAGTILLVGFVSVISSYIIFKFFIVPLSYDLGFTDAKIKYTNTLSHIVKDFHNRTLELYYEIPDAEVKSFEDYKKYLYLLSYRNSRNELIEVLLKAFEEINDLSYIDMLNETKNKITSQELAKLQALSYLKKKYANTIIPSIIL